MDIVRCQTSSGSRYGRIQGGMIRLLSHPPFAAIRYSGDEIPFESARLLPHCVPSKIICVGFNYAPHSVELGVEIPVEPLLFLKPPSALVMSSLLILTALADLKTL